MYRNASWGAIGVNVGFDDGLALAQRVGFDSVDTPLDRVVEMGAAAFRALVEGHGLRVGPWGLPVNWQGDEAGYQAGLADLPRLAAAAQSVGATRCCTWVMPCSDSRAFDENWAFHVARFAPIAKVLADHGCQLGLEFIGPATIRAGKAHEFVYTLTGMLELCAEIGPNAGLLLDLWHWYTSGGTEDELAALTNEQIVQVHVNDAPRDVALDAQIDNVRCLPGDTGVIDSATFMRHLHRCGYDGPLTVEPFNQGLRDMPAVPAAYRVKATLDYLLSL